MKYIGKNALFGYSAGIITGITYGLNPLFGLPLMKNGMSIETILFFRYGLSVLLLGLFIFISKQSFKINRKQIKIILTLGILYTCSSIFLFSAYNYMSSGLATTLIFLYPVMVAIIMMFLKVFPSWQVWLSIIVTFAGVLIMTRSDSTQPIRIEGVLLSLGSATVYALFIVIINRSKTISCISNSLLTFYALLVGSVLFFIKIILSNNPIFHQLNSGMVWVNLLGLAVLPTIISTATLAYSTRKIGATKASVLGVFEPITAILVGGLAFNEPITFNILLGIILSIAAVTFMIISSKKANI